MTTSYRPIGGDPWILARPKLKDGLKYYGAYPAGFLWRARSLLGIHFTDPLLHVCGGHVKSYAGDSEGLGPNDKTIDLEPKTNPDFLMDVRSLGLRPGKLFPLRVDTAGSRRIAFTSACVVANVEKKERAADSPLLVDGHDFTPEMLWPAALIDRPYTAEDAEHYLEGKGRELFPESLVDLLAGVMSVVRPGACVGVLDYIVPSPPTDSKFVSMTPVWCGFNNRLRAYSVFRKPLDSKVKGKRSKVTATVVEEPRGSDEPPEEGGEDEVAVGPFCACGQAAVTLLHNVGYCDAHRPKCSLMLCGQPARVEWGSAGFACERHEHDPSSGVQVQKDVEARLRASEQQPPADAARAAAFDI